MTTDPQQLELVRTALRLRASVSYAAIKKVRTMLACVGPEDNRVRGILNYHGTTPGRSTASLIQIQNFKRATIKNSEDAYRDICAGISLEMLRFCYGDPLEVLSSCVRHFVDAGSPMLDADYAAIQARIVAWLAGQLDVLDQYRQYDAAATPEEKEALCLYRKLASLIYGIPVSEVSKFPQRMVGKHARLGCGFSMGAPKFRDTVKRLSGYDLPAGLEFKAVDIYRSSNPAIKSYWYEVDAAAKRAILHPGKIFTPENRKKYVRPEVKFVVREVEGIPFLLIRLPSGRKLAYPKPRIENDRIVFYGNIQGKANWGDIDTYGGKLVENIVMGVEADILCRGLHNCDESGYEICALIHDQALSYYRNGQSPEEFVRLLTDLPEWASGLPLAAEGSLVPFYKKD